MRTLVVAAYEPELAGLPADVARRAIGIGLVEAAAGVERALADLCPARVILIGTAGALRSAPVGVGQVAVARAARLTIRPSEYVPDAMPVEIEAHPRFAKQVAAQLDAPLVDVTCSIGITESDIEAARLAQSAQLEHLECFAFLRVAHLAGIPATAVLAIANRVGSTARDEWRKSHEAAAAAARAAVLRAIGGV